MSRPPGNENGVYGANAANNAVGAPDAHGVRRDGDEPVVPPIVYHPQVGETPVYDGYADPATAHGWQNAYDETRELPPVAAGAEDGRPVGGDGPNGVRLAGGDGPNDVRLAGGDGPNDVRLAGGDGPHDGRLAGGRRSRRKPRAWPSRRVAVAAGAVGAVSVAAVIAGFSFGSSGGGARGNEDRTSPTAGDPASPTDSETSGGAPAVRSSDGGEPSRTGDPSGSTSPTSTGDETEKPAAKSPTAPTATTSPGPPGNSDGKPGRGQGGTKRPK
ncbi:hypothetical protein [Streptomyces sp. NBC_00878]|uniref:hypothetical protein n=1 Tax=Streptomyces sp. NBC_00878 TaxID=2975854 RepID=UPI00225632A8|nr:hypothetical protein [Streptomyces sp. NBC_00878]MCX4905802.1 hypothetical protein [Streptomyces sp. NBC_00878]